MATGSVDATNTRIVYFGPWPPSSSLAALQIPAWRSRKCGAFAAQLSVWGYGQFSSCLKLLLSRIARRAATMTRLSSLVGCSIDLIVLGPYATSEMLAT